MISETGSGEQQRADSTGDVKSQAGSGDLFLDRIGGGIDARTGSGDIRMTGLEESLLPRCRQRPIPAISGERWTAVCLTIKRERKRQEALERNRSI